MVYKPQGSYTLTTNACKVFRPFFVTRTGVIEWQETAKSKALSYCMVITPLLRIFCLLCLGIVFCISVAFSGLHHDVTTIRFGMPLLAWEMIVNTVIPLWAEGQLAKSRKSLATSFPKGMIAVRLVTWAVTLTFASLATHFSLKAGYRGYIAYLVFFCLEAINTLIALSIAQHKFKRRIVDEESQYAKSYTGNVAAPQTPTRPPPRNTSGSGYPPASDTQEMPS